MLTSLALIFLCALTLNKIFKLLRLPGLIGMLITGIVLGPYVLNLIDPQILAISSDLRELALIVILTRAGLALDLKDLKKVGRPAILLCFIPATLELIAVMILAPLLLGIPLLEAAIMGTVLAAVSPAVIVPRMLKLMKDGYGKDKSIPHMIMAAASVDDVYVIVLFASFIGTYGGEGFALSSFIRVPISILLGVAVGIIVGIGLAQFFKKFHMKDTVKVIVLFCVSFLFITLESVLTNIVPISGLIAVMAASATILKSYPKLAHRLSNKFKKIWIAAELMLFVLIGAALDLTYATGVGGMVLVVLIGALLMRVIGVYLSLIGTSLNRNERLFCVISFIPKATVQAAIGALPLAAGVASGNLILTIAVISIVITAPIGALGIDLSHKKLLNHPVQTD
ncbi:MAG: cation:proton antiporter [Clostridiales bacterium]|nr:cation:proton antiporter [Clostridiales bacterium]